MALTLEEPGGRVPSGEDVMELWRKLTRSRLRALLAGGIGAAAGGGYVHFVGCATGSCPLTSSVWRAAAYGLVVGVLAGWPPASPRASP